MHIFLGLSDVRGNISRPDTYTVSYFVFTFCFSVVLCETLDSFRESVSDLTSIIADTWENLPRFENAAINLI